MIADAAAPSHLTIDVITIIAIILGPILAVWASEYRAGQKERRRRQEDIFTALMTTRSTGLHPRHVEALNTIEVAFSAKKPEEKVILDSWKGYLDQLGKEHTSETLKDWESNRETHLIDLLQKMGRYLSYTEVDAVNLKKNSYFPKGHGHVAADEETIRHGMAEMWRGNGAIRMEVTAMPTMYTEPGPASTVPVYKPSENPLLPPDSKTN